MSRNLKKESEWRKKKYKRYVVDVEKDLAEEFSKKLGKEGKPYSSWVKENIKNCLLYTSDAADEL